METLYSYSGTDIAELRRTYAEVVRREYYEGELDVDGSDSLDLTVQKALAHPMSLIRVRSCASISFRRSHSHIRVNNVGVRVLWFVRRGFLKLVRSNGTCDVKAGECAILDSSVPFFARAIPEHGGTFDAVQAIVPAHLFLSHLPMASELRSSFDIDSGNRKVIAKLLDVLFGEGRHLSRAAAEALVAGFLETLSQSISDLGGIPGPQRVVDKRRADIEAYITKHLTDPDLSYNEVAASCQISPRYLCYVLKASNTSFSDLLWNQRLVKAREWIAAEAMRNHPIFQIAFMAGFKSAAHFSRIFKATYGCSPKEYRMRAWQDGSNRDASPNLEEVQVLGAA